jgi:hypothetical protein
LLARLHPPEAPPRPSSSWRKPSPSYCADFKVRRRFPLARSPFLSRVWKVFDVMPMSCSSRVFSCSNVMFVQFR